MSNNKKRKTERYIDFKVGDKVSMIHWAEDKNVSKGEIIHIDLSKNFKKYVMFIKNLDEDSVEFGEIDEFNIDGTYENDNYRTVYHGWDIDIDINNEKLTPRKEWETCTRENTKKYAMVRGKVSGMIKMVTYMFGDKVVVMCDDVEESFLLESFEIEVDI